MKLTRAQQIEALARAQRADDQAHALLCLTWIEHMQPELAVCIESDDYDLNDFSPRTRHAIAKLAAGRSGPLFALDTENARELVERYSQ